jgi:hypothetical protein
MSRFFLALLALGLGCAPSEPPRRGADGGSDMGVAREDAGPPDAGPIGVDAAVDLGVDGGPPDQGPADMGALGAFLDRCNVPTDCESSRCIDDEGPTRFCTRSCVTNGDCASDHLCADGQCVPNDVGALCDEAADCATDLCAGNPATGVGECTRTCTSAGDCPAGFACSDAGGTLVCVDIERPCAQCGTGVCLADLGYGALGCTSTCRGPADCPETLPGLEYTCTGGYCVPNTALLLGPDPMGAPCRFSGDANLCRSGVCLDDDAGGSFCSQVCDERGTCGEGFACVPSDDGAGGTVFVCLDAGSVDLGQPCTLDGQCVSGLCDTALGECTRLCTDDRLCPTGTRCVADVASGGAFATCVL